MDDFTRIYNAHVTDKLKLSLLIQHNKKLTKIGQISGIFGRAKILNGGRRTAKLMNRRRTVASSMNYGLHKKLFFVQ